MSGFVGAVSVLGAIVLFVVAHEAGHFFAAKAFGMKVTEFFLGFGPRIWSFKRGDTEYGIKPIPAGAYVRIVGMSELEEIEPEDEGKTYRDKPFWQKSVVVLAGIAANFLLGFLIFVGLAMYIGDVVLDDNGDPVASMEVAQLAAFEDGRSVPAAEAGIETGDVIVAVDGETVTNWDELQEIVAGQPGATVDITVDRGGVPTVLSATIGERDDDPTVGFLGVLAEYERAPIGVIEAARRSALQIGDQVRMTFELFARLFRFDTLSELAGGIAGNEVSEDVRPVSVVGLAQIGSQAEQLGLVNVLFLLGYVNIVLGTLNALPLPPLDGGHFAVALIEKVTRRKVGMKALIPIAVFVIGALSILGVMTIILDLVNPIEIPS